MASLILKDITKKYPSGATALHNVSIEADDREFLVIVGGEKCGKTSLLKVIAGVEDPTSGSVFIDGKDVTDEDVKDRDAAMVFRGETLIPTLNVYDNMAIGLKLRKVSQEVIDKRVKTAAGILGLNEVLYRKPKTLSAALRQRVAIARAVIREPRLYLFDEPLAGIDENLRRETLSVIANLQARLDGAFVYATKNLSEALTLGTRVAVLKNGFLQQADTPSNLYDYPANTFVAFFIGSPTINFIEKAKIVKEEGGYAASAVCGKFVLPENIVKRFGAIEDYASGGREVILGIRPEDIKCVEGGSIPVKVEKTEECDGAVYADCTDGNVIFRATLAADKKKGNLGLEADLSRLYIFDAETRLTLLSRDAGYKDTGKKDADFVPLPYKEELRLSESSKPEKNTAKKKK